MTQLKKKKIAKSNSKQIYTIWGIVLVILAFILFIAPKILNSAKEAVKNERGYITIDGSEISSKATYFDYNYNGTKMEFFAVKDTYGTVRIAFNRCQVCYDSGRGYFKQEGDEFVCQNCGNRYKISSIGTEKGGCNPSPVTSSDKIVTGNKIEIKESIFAENKYLFK